MDKVMIYKCYSWSMVKRDGHEGVTQDAELHQSISVGCFVTFN
jgi:hypothetical protein